MSKIIEDLIEAEEERANGFEGYSIEEVADAMDKAIAEKQKKRGGGNGEYKE